MTAPPPTDPVPGVRRLPLEYSGEDGVRRTVDVFEFNFADFTPALMIGRSNDKVWGPNLGVSERHSRIEEVPLGNFARWLLQETQESWPDQGTFDSQWMIEQVVSELRSEAFNAAYLDAIQLDPEHFGGHILAFLPDDHPGAPGAPVVMYLKADSPGLAEFVPWYGGQVRKAIKKQTADACRGLRKTLGAAIRELEKAFDKRQAVAEKMRPWLEKFHGGLKIIDTCLDFSKPRAERKAMFGNAESAGATFIDPHPDQAWIGRTEAFRSTWKLDLIGGSAAVMNSAWSKREIDAAAEKVMGELRDPDGPYLTMFDEWDRLPAGAQAELRNTVVRAVRLVLRSPGARDKLLDAELNSLAGAVSQHVEVAAPTGKDYRSKLLATAIEEFDGSVVAPSEDTPLGKLVVGWFGAGKNAFEHAGLIPQILGLATPFIVGRIKRRNGGKAKDAYAAMAWAWRSIVGTSALNLSRQKKLWDDCLGIFAVGPGLAGDPIEKLLDHKKGALADAHGRAGAAIPALEVLVGVLALHYACEELRKEGDSVVAQLEAFNAAVSVIKSAFKLTGPGYKTDALLQWAKDPSGQKRIAGVNLVTACGVIADAVSVIISAEKHQAANSLRKSRSAREAAQMQLYVDGIAFAVTVVAAILGYELVVVGLVLYAVGEFLTDQDNWMPLIPGTGIVAKSQPQKVLQAMIDELLDDEHMKFVGAMNSLVAHGGADLERSVRKMSEQLAIGAREETKFLWDLGGTAESNLTYPARLILRHHYGFSKATAENLVRPCK